MNTGLTTPTNDQPLNGWLPQTYATCAMSVAGLHAAALRYLGRDLNNAGLDATSTTVHWTVAACAALGVLAVAIGERAARRWGAGPASNPKVMVASMVACVLGGLSAYPALSQTLPVSALISAVTGAALAAVATTSRLSGRRYVALVPAFAAAIVGASAVTASADAKIMDRASYNDDISALNAEIDAAHQRATDGLLLYTLRSEANNPAALSWTSDRTTGIVLSPDLTFSYGPSPERTPAAVSCAIDPADDSLDGLVPASGDEPSAPTVETACYDLASRSGRVVVSHSSEDTTTHRYRFVVRFGLDDRQVGKMTFWGDAREAAAPETAAHARLGEIVAYDATRWSAHDIYDARTGGTVHVK